MLNAKGGWLPDTLKCSIKCCFLLDFDQGTEHIILVLHFQYGATKPHHDSLLTSKCKLMLDVLHLVEENQGLMVVNLSEC